jgi:hypothetical protein
MNTNNSFEIEKYAWVDALLEERASHEAQKNEEKIEADNTSENYYPEWNEDIETGNDNNNLHYSIGSFDPLRIPEFRHRTCVLPNSDSDDELIADSSFDTYLVVEEETENKRIKLGSTPELEVVPMDLDEDDELRPRRLFSHDEEIDRNEEEEDQLSIMSDIEVEPIDNNDWVIDVIIEEDEDVVEGLNNIVLPPAPMLNRRNTSWIVDGRVVFNGNPNGSRTWVDHYVDNIL